MKDISQLKKKSYETTCVTVHGSVPVIQYRIFRDFPRLIHGFSTRLGGVSEGIFESMNLSFTRGDQSEKVMENFRIFGEAVGISVNEMVFSDQTHTTNLKIVTREDLGKGILCDRDYHDIDGLITNCSNVALVTFYADCVPLLFADPVRHVIASSHSGWRGTVGKIGEKTVQKMVSEFGCRPEDIYAAVGPSICGSCYEVSQDVADAFSAVFSEEACDQFITDDHNGKYHLDLWDANRQILLDSGILPEHMAMPDICTCCNPKLMWSHRHTGGQRGSLAALIMQK